MCSESYLHRPLESWWYIFFVPIVNFSIFAAKVSTVPNFQIRKLKFGEKKKYHLAKVRKLENDKARTWTRDRGLNCYTNDPLTFSCVSVKGSGLVKMQLPWCPSPCPPPPIPNYKSLTQWLCLSRESGQLTSPQEVLRGAMLWETPARAGLETATHQGDMKCIWGPMPPCLKREISGEISRARTENTNVPMMF